MKKTLVIACMLIVASLPGCQEQLDVLNPNQPTPASAQSESGIIALAQGALYRNGFYGVKFGGSFFTVVMNYHEQMGDIIGIEIANFYFDRVGCPDRITLDDASILTNPQTPAKQKVLLKSINNPTTQGNPYYYEWAYMYSLNATMNIVLDNVDEVQMADEKKKTVMAWAWFWKGFAYSRIGSMYYAGLIVDSPSKTNNKFVAKQEIIAEAEVNFSKAENLLKSLTGNDDYLGVVNRLIPSTCQKGKGFAPTTDQWIRHINTMRARNLLVNKPVTAMTPADWDQIISWTTNGLQRTDNTFTLRVDQLGNVLQPFGFVASQAVGVQSNGGGQNKISERLIQDFKPGDKRFLNNFLQLSTAHVGPSDRGIGFNTRFVIIDQGLGLTGVTVLVNRKGDSHELFIAGTYEENDLMRAEANIWRGNIEAGLALIDEVRNSQGAGLAPTAGKGLTQDQAKEELRRERRVGLAFRGFGFYDARRWGVLENGRTGCVVVDFDGKVHTNAKIEYGFLDYWDVPVAEFFYNQPSEDSAPIVNPN